jgi:type II secretory pathway component PulF
VTTENDRNTTGKSPGWLTTDEAAELAEQLAQLADTGLPLDEGLRALADELGRGRLSRVLREMARQLEAGTALPDVIRSQGRRFPAHIRGLILAGLSTGNLADVLEEFIDLQRSETELRRQVRLSLAYPIVLLVFVSILPILFQVALLPQFAGMFREFDLELPAMTQLFLAFPSSAGWVVAGGIVGLAGIMLLLGTMPGLPWLSWLLCGIPLIGPVWRFSRLAQLCRMMGVLLQQKVPLPDALRLAAAGLRDADLASCCRRMADEVEAGHPLSECLAHRPQFPASMIPLIQWGQKTPAMADAFHASAEMFQGRTQSEVLLLETILVPILFLLVVGFILSFIIAMLLPMISLITSLSG